jgi:hypothetical protein
LDATWRAWRAPSGMAGALGREADGHAHDGHAQAHEPAAAVDATTHVRTLHACVRAPTFVGRHCVRTDR